MATLKFLADENLNGRLYKDLLKSVPDMDIVRVQDVGLVGLSDPDVLQWAADEGRIIITHDVRTLVGFAFDRVRAGETMPGVIEVSEGQASMGTLLEHLLYLIQAGTTSDFTNQVLYVPIK